MEQPAAAFIPCVTLYLAGPRCVPAPAGKLLMDVPLWAQQLVLPSQLPGEGDAHYLRGTILKDRYLTVKTHRKISVTTEDKLGGSPTMWQTHTLYTVSVLILPEPLRTPRGLTPACWAGSARTLASVVLKWQLLWLLGNRSKPTESLEEASPLHFCSSSLQVCLGNVPYTLLSSNFSAQAWLHDGWTHSMRKLQAVLRDSCLKTLPNRCFVPNQ